MLRRAVGAAALGNAMDWFDPLRGSPPAVADRGEASALLASDAPLTVDATLPVVSASGPEASPA